MIFSSAYFPPVHYMARLVQYPEILLEAHEHYIKQSYRNRCHIYTAHGLLALTVPVMHGNNDHIPVKDIRIANELPWQKIHWKSIESAYRSSPYFEFYEDDLLPFYTRRYEFLFDLNEQILASLTTLLKSGNIRHTQTVSYKAVYEGEKDYRIFFHPKENRAEADPGFMPTPYPQVFSEKHGFIPNLSIIDLLCNLGPAAINYLKESTKNNEE